MVSPYKLVMTAQGRTLNLRNKFNLFCSCWLWPSYSAFSKHIQPFIYCMYCTWSPAFLLSVYLLIFPSFLFSFVSSELQDKLMWVEIDLGHQFSLSCNRKVENTEFHLQPGPMFPEGLITLTTILLLVKSKSEKFSCAREFPNFPPCSTACLKCTTHSLKCKSTHSHCSFPGDSKKIPHYSETFIYKV